MMTAPELHASLDRLGLTVPGLSGLLHVTERTVRRWLAGDPLSRPAEQAIRAWLRLREHGIEWRGPGRPRMDGGAFRSHAATLGITMSDVARLLSVTERTARRWAAGDGVVTESAAQAIRAWLRLHAEALDWRPDAQTIRGYPADPVAWKAIWTQVRLRGGAVIPWHVDAARGTARLGDIVLGFDVSEGRDPVLHSIRPARGAADVERYRPLIEEAVFLIVESLRHRDAERWPDAEDAAVGASEIPRAGAKHA